jgi:ADP-heptose:LPS heptosyltransferase
VIEACGIKVLERSCCLRVGRDVCESIAQKLRLKGLKGDERIVVLHTGGNWEQKQWPAPHFAALTARLIRELGLTVVLSGAAADLSRVRSMALDSGCDPVVMAGETDIRELAALFKRSHMVVSADSGPLHLASAVGANVLAIFGPTRPEITGPRGQGRIRVLSRDAGCNRAPCYYLECPDNRCMKALTVDDVFQTFKILKD